MNAWVVTSLAIMSLLVAGCTTTITEAQNTIYFDDTGNKVDNMKICDGLAKGNCAANPKCVGYRIVEIVCDAGKCYC